MAATGERLASIDLFRGLTVAGMLLVNHPGDPEAVYAPLEHAAWHGWTPADLIFPFFLFVVGISIHLSLARRDATGADAALVRRQILRRAGLICLIGLVLNWYPFYQSGPIPGHDAPGLAARLVERLYRLRILGVLQRIGLAYLGASLIAWRGSTRRVAAAAAALLLGYWAAMTLLPVPGEHVAGAALLDAPGRTLAAWLDRAVLDWSGAGLGNHLWDHSVTYDPEGILSTLPAIATALLGVLAGRWLAGRRPLVERVSGLCAAGAVAAMLGLVWHWVFPINKQLWTSSYVLFTAGVAALAVGTVTWLLTVQRSDRWAWPFLVLGTNAILAYAGSELLARVLHSSIRIKLAGHWTPTELWATRQLEAAGMAAPAASLVWAVLYVALWCAIIAPLYRRGRFLRL